MGKGSMGCQTAHGELAGRGHREPISGRSRSEPEHSKSMCSQSARRMSARWSSLSALHLSFLVHPPAPLPAAHSSLGTQTRSHPPVLAPLALSDFAARPAAAALAPCRCHASKQQRLADA
jgi:hypothetical protein